MGFHITAGALALFAGAGSLIWRKGGLLHRVSGGAFVIAMLIMSLSGALIAEDRGRPDSLLVGLITAYLVASGAAAARQRNARFTRNAAAISATAAFGIGLLALSLTAPLLETDLRGIALATFVFAVSDLRQLHARHPRVVRLRRHLWRMSFALLIAAFSLFAGQAAHFPQVVQDSGLLMTPVLGIAAATAFWWVRSTRKGGSRATAGSPRAAARTPTK